MKLLAACFCVFALGSLAVAEDLKTVVKANYAAIDRAFVKRDIKAVEAAMAPRITSDFKAIASGRSHTYKDLLTNFRGMFAAFAKISSSTTKILSSKQHGNSATLEVFGTLTASVMGPDKKLHRLDLTNTSRDEWRLTAGKWKLATSTVLSETTKMDGRLLGPHKTTGV